MKSNNQKRTQKRVYEKPLLRKLTLRADEVLVKSCKNTPPAAGPSGVGCNTPQCFTIGS